MGIAGAVEVARPPVARRDPQLTVVHGDRHEDPYHWLRRKDDPEVVAHLESENAYTDLVMKPTLAFQEALYTEMLARIKEDDQTVPYRRGAYVYYSRTEKGKQYPIHCRKRGGVAGAEEVTLDLNALAAGQRFLSLGAYAVSDDGALLAYSTDVTGFREYTLHVKDLESGALLPDRVEKVSSVAWSADGRTLFYVTEDPAKRPHRLWRRRLGAVDADLIYEETDELFRLGVWRSRSLAYLFAGSRSFTSAEVRYVRADTPDGGWAMLHPREKEHEYDVDHGAGLFYLRTNGGGRRNFRLVAAPVDDPSAERWTELIPHREDVMLDDVDVFADHYVVHEREDGLVKLRVVDLATPAWHHVRFPEDAYDVSPEPNAEFRAGFYRFRYQSLVTPASVFDYDVTTRALELRKQTEVLGGYDRTRYRSGRVHAVAPDGRRVPISFVAPADAPQDGSRPLLLAGYGAYGLPYPVTFSSNRLSLLERGVTVAIAHVRGGGELGKRWHDEGRMMAKRNTFSDFVAAADFLVAQGYTSSDRLVIEGGSAGGLLIGAVVNLRPALCRAAVLRVPFVDVVNTMLDESLPLTVGEFEEWGNPKLREQYEYIKTYCPYTNLAPRDYPAILVRTGLNDSQVMYWEPAKWVAKLRTLTTSENPVLFKIDMASGHGGPSGRYDYLREIAFDYAYVLWQLGRWRPEPASASAS
ncbi:MAG: S9 family peptidase [Candidatus Rokubacteria bacterium]|nr:S9 family peptidase [Candidatus Rokubacteria bacterium]